MYKLQTVVPSGHEDWFWKRDQIQLMNTCTFETFTVLWLFPGEVLAFLKLSLLYLDAVLNS